MFQNHGRDYIIKYNIYCIAGRFFRNTYRNHFTSSQRKAYGTQKGQIVLWKFSTVRNYLHVSWTTQTSTPYARKQLTLCLKTTKPRGPVKNASNNCILWFTLIYTIKGRKHIEPQINICAHINKHISSPSCYFCLAVYLYFQLIGRFICFPATFMFINIRFRNLLFFCV